MTDFIKKLEKEFNTQIIYSKEHIGRNYYNVDEDGKITTLYLDGIDLKDLDILLPVADSLINLGLGRCNLKILRGIKYFTQLETLDLCFNNLHNSTLVNLSQLKKLKKLNLKGTNIKDTSHLGNLTNLEMLFIGFSKCLYEIKGLENLNSLHHLDASYSEIDNLENVCVNENLRSLNLERTDVKRITHLKRFPNLESLNLDGTFVEKIEGLDTFKNLKKLFISTAGIERIEGLESLTKLEVLDLHLNEISKIEGLDNLTNLKWLSLNENQISKVENLDNLINLELLLLEPNNTVTYFDTSFFHNLVSECHIYIRDIKDIDVIQDAAPNNVKINFDNDYPYPTTLYRRPTGIFE